MQSGSSMTVVQRYFDKYINITNALGHVTLDFKRLATQKMVTGDTYFVLFCFFYSKEKATCFFNILYNELLTYRFIGMDCLCYLFCILASMLEKPYLGSTI